MSRRVMVGGAGLVLLVLAGLAWWSGWPHPVTPDGPGPATAPSALRPGEIVSPAPRPLAQVETEKGYLRLPDGSYLPNLNGVTGSAELRWVGEFPAVRGTIRNAADGVDWYVLDNGDRITTVNRPGTHRGKAVRRDLVVHVRRAELLK